jgi:hypothetical protein
MGGAQILSMRKYSNLKSEIRYSWLSIIPYVKMLIKRGRYARVEDHNYYTHQRLNREHLVKNNKLWLKHGLVNNHSLLYNNTFVKLNLLDNSVNKKYYHSFNNLSYNKFNIYGSKKDITPFNEKCNYFSGNKKYFNLLSNKLTFFIVYKYLNCLCYKSITTLKIRLLQFILLSKYRFLFNFNFILFIFNLLIYIIVILQNPHISEVMFGLERFISNMPICTCIAETQFYLYICDMHLHEFVLMEGNDSSDNPNGESLNKDGSPNPEGPNPHEDNPVSPTNEQDKEYENRRREQEQADRDRIGDCEHRSRDRVLFRANGNPNAMPCSFDSGNGPHLAISRPYDEAILCQRCGAVICVNCNDPNSDSEKDSGFSSE